MTVVWDVAPYSLVDIDRRFRGAFSASIISVYQTARCNIPVDIHIHTRRRENLKSHLEYKSIM
jgi:hypothetical protein